MRKKKGYWESFDDIDGLLHNCRCLLEDRDGNIWIGTFNGLCRYDGKEFFGFTHKDGLPDNKVQCIHQDKEGNIWIGTTRGLCRYDGMGFVNLAHDALSDNNIRCIYQDRESNIWIGTWGGLSRYDGGGFVRFTYKDGLVSNNIRCIHQDREDNIWIGTGKGLSRYDGAGFVNFTDKDGLADNGIRCIHQDREDNIWIGTGKGLSRYDGAGFVNFTDKDGLADNGIRCIYQDREDNIWIGTSGGGTSCFNGSGFANFNTEHGLAHNSIFDIIQDREGSLWFACHHAGICRYNPYEISSISDEAVSEVMMQNRDGDLWWGSGNILSQYDGEVTTHHYSFKSAINELFEDSKGRFWIGTAGEGVFVYNTKDVKAQKPKNLTTDDGLASNGVWKIREDIQGNIWIGTWAGVSRYNGMEFTNFTTDDGLGDNLVSVIFQDSDGILLFAGWKGGGITAYDGENFSRYSADDGLASDELTCIMEDDRANLWIATHAGISYYDGKSFRDYTTEAGLLSSHAQRILQDSKGQIWIATLGGGINRFDGRNFQALTTEDGLPSNNVTGIIEDSDGSMIISTYTGICKYVPDYETPPLIRIDEVDADRIYKKPEDIKISESVSSIRIRYYGISFRTKRMRYNYILEGYDKEWKATWDEEVRYENLPMGDYTFNVIAINKDLLYSERTAKLRLRVVADARNRVISELEEKVRERTKELEEKTEELFQSNHELNTFIYTMAHDLKAPAVSLQGFSTLLMGEYGNDLDENGKMYVSRIQMNSERIGNLIERLLDLFRIGRVKNRNERVDVSNLLRSVIHELTPKLEKNGTKVIVSGEMPTVRYDRAMMSRIFIDLMNNANKYMGEDNREPTIEIGYEEQDSYHKFYVKDNGIGIDEKYHEKIFQILQRLNDIETEGTGIGLTIVKKMVENFGGEVWVDSAKGRGTTMYFTIPKREGN